MDEKLYSMIEDFIRTYKFINKPIVAERLNNELSEDLYKKIYELSDGEKSTRDIASEAGTNHSLVHKLWQKWAMSGIVVPAKRSGRFMKAFDLVEYGLSVLEED